MPIDSFTVDGVDVRPVLKTFEVRETVGGVSTLSCDIVSVGSPVIRFGVFSDVAIVESGTTIFAGTITQSRERGVGGPVIDGSGHPQISTTITAEDYNRLADRVTVTEDVAAGTTLKAFLTTLVTTYLSGFSITLDAAQATGPTLGAMSFDIARASEVLQALAAATGYIWRIGYDKALRMWASGDLTAPFNINQSDVPHRWGNDVEVETTLGDNYANRVIVVSGQITITDQTDTLVGDGVTDTIVTTYPILKQNHFVVVTPGGFMEPLGDGHITGPTWTIGTDNRTLTRLTGALEVGFTARVTYDGLLELSQTAEDAGEIAAHGLYEVTVRNEDVRTDAAALALATQILADRLHAVDQVVSYTTRYPASTLRAGQQQSITAPARDLSGDYILRDMRIIAETDPTSATGWLTRIVTAKQTQPLTGKWQDTYHDWLQVGGGGSSTVQAGTGTTVVAAGPAPPDTSVQFNRSGGFGGDYDFTYDEDSATAMIGSNHTPDGTANLLVGDGHAVVV